MKGKHKGVKGLAAGLGAALLAVSLFATQALAAPTDTGGTQTRAITGTVSDTVSPVGTTINLFDYWLQGRYDSDKSTPQNYQNLGINQGHQLNFRNVTGTGINGWTGTEKPFSDMVEDTLQDGYPKLVSQYGGESLRYLFDPSYAHNGKASYSDVGNLLQIDSDNYYYYNSQKNFAEYDEDSNAFVLYNDWAVAAGGASPNGQFFPFNALSKLSNPQSIQSTNGAINHYFGLTMTTRFVQQEDGRTEDGKIVTYEFSGDDDVWVFIDNVLVGDLGGIHDAASLKIDFSTGEITINGRHDGTLRSKYQNAGRGDATNWDGDTFADGTYHTLRFYYLERGNVDSNMSLKFNLVSVPQSDLRKVDQQGNPVQGAQFELYTANDNYEAGSKIATGTTDGDGTFVFQDDEGMLLSLNDLKEKYGGTGQSGKFVLKEISTPAGYRPSGDMHLYFPTQEGFTQAVLLSGNAWDTGAYASPIVTATLPDVPKAANGDTVYDDPDQNNGTYFAVVLAKDADGYWHTVSGDPLNGWTVYSKDGANATMEDVLQAARADQYIFQLDSSGAYKVTIENLPGDIKTYYHMLLASKGPDAAAAAEFTVAYYYTEASNLSGATVGNTHRLNSDILDDSDPSYFEREFSVRLYVPNIKNYLLVQKVDENGEPMDKTATFNLYTADQVDTTGEVPVLKADAQPYDTVTTGKLTSEDNGITLDSAAVFPTQGHTLDVGQTYYLQEAVAPDGYTVNPTLVEVRVDETGVYADAGNADDDISVLHGVGRVVSSMLQFAVPDEINTNLTDVTASLYTSNDYPADPVTDSGAINWSAWTDAQKTLDLSYNTNGPIIEYGPTYSENGERFFEVTGGWSSIQITQNYDAGDPSYKEELKDENQNPQDLTRLFSRSTIVRVQNEPVSVSLSADQQFTVSKTIAGRDWQTGDSFTFTLKAQNGAPMPEGTNADQVTIAYDPGATTHTATFETIRYTQTGIYTYTITETASVATDLVQDPHTATVTVTVGTDDNGQLKVESVNYANTDAVSKADADNTTQAAFTNAAGPVTGDIEGTKLLTGRDLETGEFQFVLKRETAGQDGTSTWTEVSTVANGEATSVQDGQQATFGFDSLPLPAQDGATARFLVEEVNGNKGGVTYDAHVYLVTFTVTRQNDGSFAASKTIQQFASEAEAISGTASGTDVPAIQFTNTYQATGSVTAQIHATKTLDGRDLEDGEFTFQLKDANGHVQETATNDADGNVTFPELTFTAAGDYTYTVSEVQGDAVGVTYDDTEYTVVIHVTDNGTGGFAVTYTVGSGTATPTAPDLAFANSYSTQEGSFTLRGTKQLDGQELTANQFSFSVYNTDANGQKTGDAIASARNAADGALTFSAVQFSATGTQTLWVEENNSNQTGVTYDSGHYLVTVEVTDPKTGTYQAAVTGLTRVEADGTQTTPEYAEGAGLAFTNRYQPNGTTLTIPATKELTGRAINAGEFSFRLKADEGNSANDPVPAEGLTTTAAADGKIQFSLSYTQEGTYGYTVSEVPGTLGGITYDTATYHLQVTVTDVNGTLQAGYTVDGGAEIVFHNEYTIREDAKITVNGSKTTSAPEGADPSSYQFSYVVRNADTGAVAFTDNSTADGNFQFGLTFNAAGTYRYTIGELDSGASGQENKGITYDTAQYDLTVTVTDNGDGTLSTSQELKKADGTVVESADFTNDYDGGTTPVDLTAELSATKVLTGRTLQDGEFHFVVLDENNTEQATGRNNADGSITFGSLYYTDEDYGTHTYTVREVVPGTGEGPGGITYDQNSFTFTVEVTDNGDGTMSATVTKPEGGITFTNTYQAGEVQVPLTATKTLDGMPLSAGMFQFELYDENGTLLHTVSNDESGNVSFPNFVFQDRDLGDATEKTFRYTVQEKNTGRAGVTYDGRSYEVAITVRDDGNGQLQADAPVITCDGADVETITFANTYQPADATLNLTATKTLTGRDLQDGEFGFTVQRQQADGSWSDVASGSNLGSQIAFSPITFTETGTYTLRVAENNGALGGVLYDDSVYYLTVTVSDAGNDGQLDAAVTAITKGTQNEVGTTVQDVSFTNRYTARQATVTLTGEKTLTGRDMRDKEFSFSVYEGENLVGSAYNQTDGTLVFTKLYYTAPGTHTLTVRENSGAQANGIVYDDAVFTAVVTVTDDGQGSLQADVAYPDGAIQFQNQYIPTEAQVTLTGAKELTGKALEDQEFRFVVKEGDTYVATGTNDAEGNIQFTPIHFQSDDVGEHTYTVSEVNGGRTQITYDTTVYTVTVQVTDDGNGKVNAQVTYPEGGLTFRNRYAPTPVEVVLQANKQMTGRALTEAEFIFKLQDSDGKILARARNDAQGLITFAPLKFTQAGSYTYTLYEEAGQAEGVTYDATRFTLTVKVVDDNGVLKAEVQYPEGGAIFHNSYQDPEEGDGSGDSGTPSTPSGQTPSGSGASGTAGGAQAGATVTIPQTGDEMPLELIIGVLIVAGCAFVGLLVARKRKNDKK